MTTAETERRRDQIVALLREHGELSVTLLAERMGVSVQTLRSDLRALDEARVVRRRHGAARLNALVENISYQPRLSVARAEKARIAAAVAATIPDGATVALGTGTTVEAVAHALAGHRGLTVATNNLHVALALRAAEDITLLLAGGEVRLRDLDVIGPDSLAFFGGLNFEIAVFSVGGMTGAGDLLDFTTSEIQARKAITACAGRRVLVLDQAKIGRSAPFSWGNAAGLEAMVCGAGMPPDLRRALAGGGCALTEV